MQQTDEPRPKRFAFVIQGEGRGHLTQAIALKGLLEKRGHEVCAVLVGKSPVRVIPSFFKKKIGCEILQYDSPNFIRDRKQKGVRVSHTVTYNLRRIGTYNRSLHQIHDYLEKNKPDVIVNFYEVLFGLYSVLYQPNATIFCIGHQYLNGHPDFPYPPRTFWNKFLFKLNTWLTGLRCRSYLALSFDPYSPFEDPFLSVVPPVLRADIFDLKPTQGDHFLVYLLNEGYFEELIRWHKKNPQYKIHAFWDKKDVEDPYEVSENLIFHQISDTLFLELMASCRGLATTAGFESVSEAAYLGKPVLMVPTKGHFEQRCNALDAQRAGIGIYSRKFDLTRLIEFEKNYRPIPKIQDWIENAEDVIIPQLERGVENQSFSKFLSRVIGFIFRKKPAPSVEEESQEEYSRISKS